MSRIKAKKSRLNYLWALVGIPVLLGGTIAASCSPVSSSDQVQEDENVHGIKWKDLSVKKEYSGLYADEAVQKHDLVQMVNWDSKVNLSLLTVKDILEANRNEGTVKAVVSYNGSLADAEIRGFKIPPVDSQIPDEEKYQALLSDFSSKVVLNEKGKTQVTAKQITKQNIGEYINVFYALENGELTYKQAKVRLYDLYPQNDNSLRVEFSLDAYGILRNQSIVVSGFLSFSDYETQEFHKYVNSYTLKPRSVYEAELKTMHATRIFDEKMFSNYFELNNNSQYQAELVPGTLKWPSISSIEVTVKLSQPGTSNVATKVVSYSGFNDKNTNNLQSKVTQTIFDYQGIIFHMKELDYTNWDGLKVDWKSLKTINYVYREAQSTAMTFVKLNGIYQNLLREAVNYYGQVESWQLRVQMTQRSYDIISQNRIDHALHIKGWPLWADPVAYLQLWTPEFNLVLTNDKLPWLRHEFKIYLKNSKYV